MFNKDITIINRYIDKASRMPKYKVSYVKGFWSSTDGISINGTQITKTDRLSARILMSEKSYQQPSDFLKNPKGWTLQNDDYLVKGKVTGFTTVNDLLDNYSEVMKITNIAVKDYGSEDMWHWSIAGE